MIVNKCDRCGIIGDVENAIDLVLDDKKYTICFNCHKFFTYSMKPEIDMFKVDEMRNAIEEYCLNNKDCTTCVIRGMDSGGDDETCYTDSDEDNVARRYRAIIDWQ